MPPTGRPTADRPSARPAHRRPTDRPPDRGLSHRPATRPPTVRPTGRRPHKPSTDRPTADRTFRPIGPQSDRPAARPVVPPSNRPPARPTSRPIAGPTDHPPDGPADRRRVKSSTGEASFDEGSREDGTEDPRAGGVRQQRRQVQIARMSLFLSELGAGHASRPPPPACSTLHVQRKSTDACARTNQTKYANTFACVAVGGPV